MKFNAGTSKAKSPKKIINKAGGEAYAQTTELELVSLVLTSFVSDQYYEKKEDNLSRMRLLAEKSDPEFAAKLAVYARHTFGMRSISHALAAELAKRVSGKEYARGFYEKVIRRPDDMTEILSYYRNVLGQKTMPAAMKAGFARAITNFDSYQIGKWKGSTNKIKLVDIANLTHPKPTEKSSDGLKGLVEGTIRRTGTWEDKLSAAGQRAETEAEKTELKKETWTSLLKERKLGTLALVRNLRNILKDAPEMVDIACSELENADKIYKSKIFPFQLITAYKELSGADANTRKIKRSLEKAVDLSCRNVPDLKNTLVAIDNSGSMESSVTGSKLRRSEAGAMFGMILAKRCNADVMEFGDRARYISYDLDESVLKFSENFPRNNKVGHGTNFRAIFQTANKAYDRVVIFSDMQGWVGYNTPDGELKSYEKTYKCEPFVYSFDLSGYGSLQFPQDRVFALAGFSGEVFSLMEKLEIDREALINEIKAVDLTSRV